MFSASNEVLTCGYSFHRTPFSMNNKELPSFLFRLQTEGSCQALVDGRMEDILAGDLLLYKPGDPYELRIGTSEEEKRGGISSGDYYLFCQGRWLEEWWANAADTLRPKSHIVQDERILNLWREIILEKRRLSGENREISDYLVRTLCLSIERAIGESVPRQTGAYLAYRMKQYVEEHAVRPLKLEDVARHVGLSVSRAAHLYKETFGSTIIRDAMEIRLAFALEKMAYSTMTLEQIAETSGFGSYTYFHRVFRSRYGCSPQAYRCRFPE